jgi:hypothetical protein
MLPHDSSNERRSDKSGSHKVNYYNVIKDFRDKSFTALHKDHSPMRGRPPKFPTG